MVRAVSKGFLWLIVGVIFLELLLQLGSLAIKATGRDVVEGWATGNTRVLTLGDSNTYGLFLPPEESYPAQLEMIWNKTFESPKVEVVNLGYPGTNSSVLLNTLPKLLDTFKPDVVTIMVGVNDFWTDVVQRTRPDDGMYEKVLVWLRESSRTYKLLYMVERSFFSREELDLGERHVYDPEKLDEEASEAIRKQVAQGIKDGKAQQLSEVRYGDEKFELGFVSSGGAKGNLDILRSNLVAIASEIERSGMRAVFLTYPAEEDWYEATNIVLRSTAEEIGVPLVDVAKALKEQCPETENCSHLFFPDYHARAPGYRIAAERLVADLHRLGVFADE